MVSQPETTEDAPDVQDGAEQDTERDRGLFEQLHHDARLSTLALPVGQLHRTVVVFVQEEQGLAAGHTLKQLQHETGHKLKPGF